MLSINNEKNLYFDSNAQYIKRKIAREHEYFIWKFQYYLRKEESSSNILVKLWYRRKKNILGTKLGFLIPAGVFDSGLHIWHYGCITVNGYAKVGKNCILHGDNCIGNNGTTLAAPKIGNNVDIGVGAKIIGDITIADNVKIGAGAVVVKSVTTPGVTVVGIPGRVIGHESVKVK